MRGDVVELCGEGPRDRPSLLRALVERGHPSLEQGPINTFVPWLSTQGLIVTDTAGLLHAADPPPAVNLDEALAILGARYRAGYGPCDATDLAKWSSLPTTQARRALEAAGPPSDVDLLPTDDTPPCLLLTAFDTLMLGYRTRAPFVVAEDDHHILRGGGMLKARWDDEAGRTAVEVAGVELTEPYAVLLADQTTEEALAWVEAVKAQERPETDGKRPRRAERAVSGAFSMTDISIYEVLAEGERFELSVRQ